MNARCLIGLIRVKDYSERGWLDPSSRAERGQWYAERLEEGEILFFPLPPFALADEDREFLYGVRQKSSSHYKNISYRPEVDRVKGYARGETDTGRLLTVMRRFSQGVRNFASDFLAAYGGCLRPDYASFRPVEEEGRRLALKSRNDLLHVDSFPTRPSNGDRILRVFTNLNAARARVWLTTSTFDEIVKEHARPAGLGSLAARARSFGEGARRAFGALARRLGVPLPDRSPYDRFMMGFHHYLKASHRFQSTCPKFRWEFPPLSAWLVYTDMVPHAVLAGQYALEQTFIVSRRALLVPHKAPAQILENLVGVPLTY